MFSYKKVGIALPEKHMNGIAQHTESPYLVSNLQSANSLQVFSGIEHLVAKQYALT